MIEGVASGAVGLGGYGRGIVAIAAGTAEMRLVDNVLSSPTPTTWDPELKAAYQAALDDALEPRRERGRIATLAGLRDFVTYGIITDTRVDRARALLSKLHPERKVDALDGLLVPPRPKAAPGSPSAYWTSDIPPENESAIFERGLPLDVRSKFYSRGAPGLMSAYARTRLDMGRVYWRRVDFIETAYAAKASSEPDDRLVLAIALALVHAPDGLAAMMASTSPAALELGHTEALDALAAESSPIAGMAAFDAAYLRALSPPDGARAPAYFRDVAARFRNAESLLTEPAHKMRAAERAKEADAIASGGAEK
ncbi:MAG: hypothetical protein JST00_18120 [Deltaproteobacteria bacterium]|nr:hypothetical protein [Deltaproteobacteria bacterium]